MRTSVLVVAALIACNADPISGDAAIDVPTTDAAARCTDDSECNDDLYCNGGELCRPDELAADDRGCVSGELPCPESTCEESSRTCRVHRVRLRVDIPTKHGWVRHERHALAMQ